MSVSAMVFGRTHILRPDPRCRATLRLSSTSTMVTICTFIKLLASTRSVHRSRTPAPYRQTFVPTPKQLRYSTSNLYILFLYQQPGTRTYPSQHGMPVAPGIFELYYLGIYGAYLILVVSFQSVRGVATPRARRRTCSPSRLYRERYASYCSMVLQQGPPTTLPAQQHGSCRARIAPWLIVMPMQPFY